MYKNNLFCMNMIDWWNMVERGKYDKPDKCKILQAFSVSFTQY